MNGAKLMPCMFRVSFSGPRIPQQVHSLSIPFADGCKEGSRWVGSRPLNHVGLCAAVSDADDINEQIHAAMEFLTVHAGDVLLLRGLSDLEGMDLDFGVLIEEDHVGMTTVLPVRLIESAVAAGVTLCATVSAASSPAYREE